MRSRLHLDVITPRHPGRRIRASFVGAPMALALLVASTIHAQGVGTTMPVYHEDFASESTFPTEPELDVFGQGGMVRYPFVGAGSSVVLDGAMARLSLAAGTAFQPLFAGAGLASWSVPGEPLVVSVTFGGYASNLAIWAYRAS